MIERRQINTADHPIAGVTPIDSEYRTALPPPATKARCNPPTIDMGFVELAKTVSGISYNAGASATSTAPTTAVRLSFEPRS